MNNTITMIIGLDDLSRKELYDFIYKIAKENTELKEKYLVKSPENSEERK